MPFRGRPGTRGRRSIRTLSRSSCGRLSRSSRCERMGSASSMNAKAAGQSAGLYPAARSQ